MYKQKIEDIVNETLPEQSKDLYVKKWEEFKKYVGDKNKPEESDYIQYFDYLHSNKKLKASSIWSTYSMLNSLHQREYGEKLQQYPKITQLLKSYNNNYERKVASVFDKKSVDDYLSLPDASPFVLVRKACVVISLCGGLRTSELRDISVNDVVKKGDAYEITLQRKKQHGEKKKSKFIVPSSLASHVTNYLQALEAALEEVTGPLIKSSNISIFVNQPIGVNLL